MTPAWLAAQASPKSGGLTLSAAIERTLTLDAQIARASWTREETVGALRRADGAFDLALTATAARRGVGEGAASTTVPETVTEYGLGLSQRLRSGVVITPRVTLQHSQFPAVGLSPAYSVADMGMGLSVPLLRGRGGGFVTAAREAAQWLREASDNTLEHQRGASVLAVVQAYWAYVAATRRLAVLQGAESRAQRLVEQTRALIEADERPAADEIRVRAHHASKRASRLAVERALIEARTALATAMGITREAMEALPPPATPLPDLTVGATLPTAPEATELALARRQDLVAAGREWRAAAAMVSGAHSEARPRFDLSVGIGYAGATAGSALDAFSAGRGLHTSVSASLGLPVQNREAAGLELQEQARLERAKVGRDELARRVALDATTAAVRLSATAEEMSRAHEATSLYYQDVQNEEERFRLGASTLFDLLYSQDGLTAAALAELDAQFSFAISLALLRFETGTLFQSTGDTAPVDVDALIAWRR
jgi:outer membrane protein TolC